MIQQISVLKWGDHLKIPQDFFMSACWWLCFEETMLEILTEKLYRNKIKVHKVYIDFCYNAKTLWEKIKEDLNKWWYTFSMN